VNYVSPDGSNWRKIDGSPVSFGIVGDGKRIFTGIRFPNGNTTQPFFSAPADHDTTWTSLASPAMPDGPVELRYDSDHHLLYAATMGSGLWRMVTE
jgi:hypothetical protein